jgi:hypothetical protein
MKRHYGTGDEKRTVMLRLRVSNHEKERLQELSKNAGLSLSDWIRKEAIGSKPVLRKPTPYRETLLRLLGSLNKQGSLLNQVARQLNRKQDSDEFEVPIETINDLLEKLKALTTEIRNEFKHGSEIKDSG